MKKIFTGIMPALVTPLKNDNKTVNEEVEKQIIDYLLNQGADGFYILGGTGEGLVMGVEERKIVCETAVKHINKRKPVICHIASMNFNEAIELAKHAEKMGVDAVAAVPPSVFFYDSDDIYQYYKKLATSVTIPVIVYYFPGAQKDMSAKLISKIFDIDNVTGVKWSSDDFYEMMKLKDMTHGEMNIINGRDELFLLGLAAGADAGVGSTYNVMLPEFIEIYKYFHEKKNMEALEIQMKVNRVIDRMIKNEIIPSVKYAMLLLGFDVGEATFPMRNMTKEQCTLFEGELKSIGWPF